MSSIGGVGRRTLFDKEQDFLACEKVVEETLKTCRMRICAFCTLSNHWLWAYPKTEQKATTGVEQDMDVIGSLHGGGYASRLVRSVCRCRRKCGGGWGRCCPGIRRSRKGGRPRVNLRGVANGIFYLLRTGCQWKALPPQFGSPRTVHRYFQEWSRRRVFHRFWKKCLQMYDVRRGIGWRWQALDGSMTKAPLGGEKNR